MSALTAAQADALRYVALMTGVLPYTTDYRTPRRDVLQRLAGLGLVTREVTASRSRNADRWTYDAKHTLTEAGLAALLGGAR